MSAGDGQTREGEWFVPKFGPRRFRLLAGLSFYPYTLMNASYVVIGSALSPSPVSWDRVAAMCAVYILSVGISAHALDATGPNKPWGAFLSRRLLFGLAACALVPALAIGLYYALSFTPYLLAVGTAELVLLFAYNLELFGRRFHTDLWFAFSWGMLPVLAGYVSQTNSLSPIALGAGVFGLTTSFTEINASRPYKSLRRLGGAAPAETFKFENILKGLVLSHISLALALVGHRLWP